MHSVFFSGTGSLTVLKRTGPAGTRRSSGTTSRTPSQSSLDAQSYASTVDLSCTEKLPPIDTPEASHVCSIRSVTSLPTNTKHLYSICTRLDQRRRRWADVVQKCFVFAGLSVITLISQHQIYTQCWLNAGPVSQTLAQHYINLGQSRTFYVVSYILCNTAIFIIRISNNINDAKNSYICHSICISIILKNKQQKKLYKYKHMYDRRPSLRSSDR